MYEFYLCDSAVYFIIGLAVVLCILAYVNDNVLNAFADFHVFSYFYVSYVGRQWRLRSISYQF